MNKDHNNSKKPNSMLGEMENLTRGNEQVINVLPDLEDEINKKFFNDTIKAHLTEDKIKQKIGDLNKKWKKDNISENLSDEEKRKLALYELVEVA